MEQEKKKRGLALFVWLCVLGPVLAFALVLWLTSLGIFGELPTVENLENPRNNEASLILSSDLEVLGKYYRENRVLAEFEEISPNVIDALIATEDERFYNHSGIDARSTLRAILFLGSKGGASTITQQVAKMLFTGGRGNVVVRSLQKFKEWIISARLERKYTKDEIITLYLNKFDFVNNAVGIKSAAQVYFNTSADSLNLSQAAMLVGMAKNPSLFNPIRRPDTTLHRRNVVFSQMQRSNLISAEERDSLSQLPLGLNIRIEDHKEGIAPYFREVLRKEMEGMLRKKDEDDNYIYAKPDGKPYYLYEDGLRIYTTINSNMQRYSEYAVRQHLGSELQEDFWNNLKKKKNAPFDWRVSKKQIENIMQAARKRTDAYRVFTGRLCPKFGVGGNNIREEIINDTTYFISTWSDLEHRWVKPDEDSIQRYFDTPHQTRVFSWEGMIDTVMSPNDSIKYYKSFLQAGLLSMDPQTGYIKAWVGGINFKNFQYDHVKQSRRQVGSTFKPFVYNLAIQNGYSPCYEVPNVIECFDMPKPQPKYCPENSDDDYGYNVTLRYGMANSMNTVTSWVMKRFGPQAVVDYTRRLGITSPLQPVPSLALGVADLSLYEMVGAYGTFANKGQWTQPVYLLRVEDKNGNIIAQFTPETREVMSEESAYVMLDLMKGVTGYNWNEHKGKNVAGTGVRLRFETRPYGGIKYPIAGKTGTTQNNSDGWFMGITPDLVTGVWVGAEDRSVRFSRTYYGQGANMALPIWGYYMKKIYDNEDLDISKGDFEKPTKPISVQLNCKEKDQKGSIDFYKIDDNTFNN